MKTIKFKNGKTEISFKLNGKDITTEIKSTQTLLELIRSLGYKGTKKGCDGGECGSCTVLVDENAVLSCILPAFYANGKNITTIEGIGDVTSPHPIQKAFVEAGAVQCGFCIPGMIMTTKFLLDRIPEPDEKTIKHYLDGNLCRCTGYVKQIEAVKLASKKLKK